METAFTQLPPEGMLKAAVDALLGEEPAELDPQVALCRARILQHESERLAAAALSSIHDLDARELFALDGAGSARGWLRQQPAGDQGQLSLARRLRTRTVVRAALEGGNVNTRAAASVCSALVTVDDIEAGDGVTPAGIGEDQVHGVLVNAVPSVLQAWVGFDDSGSSNLPDDDADLRNEIVGRRALLAEVLIEASEGVGLPVSQRLEPVFTLMARALSPHALSDALTVILDALIPERLESEDEDFDKLKHFTHKKRAGRGWEGSYIVDDEEGEWLDADHQARLKLLRRTPENPTDAHEAADDTDDEPVMDWDGAGDSTYDNTDFGTDASTDDAPASPEPTTPTANTDTDTASDARSDDAEAPADGDAEAPVQPGLFDADDDGATAKARFGTAGRGVDPVPWSRRREAPVEGRAHDGAVIRKKGYAAFRMLLRDRLAESGTGSPSPAHLSIVVNASFLTGQPGAPHPVLDGKRLTQLTEAALKRLSCDSLMSAVILDAAGRPLAASGQHRSFTGRERRAMRAQWGWTCAVNACGLPGIIPHHVELYSRTGRTSLKDGVPVCEGHHHDVHDDKRTLRLRDGRLINEDGWVLSPLASAA